MDIYTQMLMNLLSQGGYGGGGFGGNMGMNRGMSPWSGVPQQGGYQMQNRPQQGGYGMQMPPSFFGQGFAGPQKQGPPQQGGYRVPYQGTPLTQFRNRFVGPPSQAEVQPKRGGGGIEPVGGKKYYEPGGMIHLGDNVARGGPGFDPRRYMQQQGQGGGDYRALPVGNPQLGPTEEEMRRRQRGGGGRSGGPWGSVYGY